MGLTLTHTIDATDRRKEGVNAMTNGNEMYNGHGRPETWAFNRHWRDDPEMTEGTIEVGREHIARQPEVADAALGRSVIDYWERTLRRIVTDALEGADPLECALARKAFQVLREIGSFWRVDPEATGAAVRRAIDNSEGA